MSDLLVRQLTDSLVTFVVMAILIWGGAGLYSLILIPYRWWKFYDGYTRAAMLIDPPNVS